MYLVWRVAAALLGGISICAPVVAETACRMRGDFIRILADVYEEQVVGKGLTPDGRLIELAWSENGSYTILVTMASDIACVITAGTGWEALHNNALDLPEFPHRMRR